ncbi:hypothetical protein A8C56_08345 [Niabella ginsenosidivorans]|uniref:Uncharacterized protein n=1 Tax=Niabella ginsenosidivorans TaxID=1176587 RepID=A0A1A9I002_9BACT|nr:hypothetical protein [Niabella ginsenosidivorans]ANH80987.1 hypothetical protein A8C56_08345 [Niabella ginsenosidivorans]
MRDRKGGPAAAGPVRSTAPLHSPTLARVWVPIAIGMLGQAGGTPKKRKPLPRQWPWPFKAA